MMNKKSLYKIMLNQDSKNTRKQLNSEVFYINYIANLRYDNGIHTPGVYSVSMTKL